LVFGEIREGSLQWPLILMRRTGLRGNDETEQLSATAFLRMELYRMQSYLRHNYFGA